MSAEWIDFTGLLLTLAGMVIGLGSVTVIDFHALLGRTSTYWKQATVRTHKITKPLIWLGLFVAITGATILYRHHGFTGTIPLQAIVALALAINGSYLTFWISPILVKQEREGRAATLLPMKLQKIIAVSFALSLVGWWAELFLLTWYLVFER